MVLPADFTEIIKTITQNPRQDFLAKFFVQLLTPNEIQEISQRWQIVKMLEEGIPQRKIASQLHTSLCKITRGSRELKKQNSLLAKILSERK